MRTRWMVSVSVLLFLTPSFVGAQNAPRTWTVSPGQSIQKAIDNAAPGDTVQVLPGEFVQEIEITKDNITLKGMEYEGERATLTARENEEDEPLRSAITIGGNGVTVEGLVITGFSRFGVVADNCTDVVVRDVMIREIGQMGVGFDDVRKGLVERVVAGVTGFGIAIEDSIECSVVQSEAFYSRVGLFIRNSQQLTIENGSFHDNAIGMAFSGTTTDEARRLAYVKVLRCRAMGNNANIGAPKEYPMADVPNGVGIVLAGTVEVEIAHGVIADNGSMGVMTMSYGNSGADKIPSERTYLHHNYYAHNGDAPSDEFKKGYEGISSGDLYWDGQGERNQFQESTDLKTYPEKLVVEQGGVHTNVIHFQ